MCMRLKLRNDFITYRHSTYIFLLLPKKSDSTFPVYSVFMRDLLWIREHYFFHRDQGPAQSRLRWVSGRLKNQWGWSRGRRGPAHKAVGPGPIYVRAGPAFQRSGAGNSTNLKGISIAYLQDGRSSDGSTTLEDDVECRFDWSNFGCYHEPNGNGWINVTSTNVTNCLEFN
jgi:hypothetical protein